MKKGLLSLALAGMLNLSCSASTSNLASSPSSIPSSSAPSTPDSTSKKLPSSQEQKSEPEKPTPNPKEEQMKKVFAGLVERVHDLMAEQWEKLGISYEGMKFSVQLCPADTPDIFIAVYSSDKNMLCLDPKLIQDVSLDVKDKNYNTLMETIRHELGHVYTDQRSEQLGNGDWPEYKTFDAPLKKWGTIINWHENAQFEERLFARKTLRTYQERNKVVLTKALLLRMISEGISEYFRGFGKEPDEIKDIAFPQSVDELLPLETTLWAYPLGYHLVKPILDAYGAKGIDYLITHLPESTGNMYEDAIRYREQAMEELEKTK